MPSLLRGHSDICEDALRVERPDDDTTLIAVADGAGVQRGGGDAARLACDAAVEEMLAMGERRRRKDRAWERLIRRIDARVGDAPEAGACTLVAIALDGGTIAGVSVGDSAAWVLGRSADHDLTVRQPAAPLIGDGAGGGAVFHATLPGPASVDDRGKHGGGALVVMTDGVWRYVDRRFIIDAALHNGPETALRRIEEMARAGLNGRLIDDFALVIVRR